MLKTSSRPHLKIVVIGRSGAGKTTFINTLMNHFYEVEYDEERLVPITQTVNMQGDSGSGDSTRVEQLPCNIKEFDTRQSTHGVSEADSQTTKPNIYDFENPHLTLTIVDTPGLGDTRGLAQDQANIKEIATAVAALTDFNAIVLVHKATDCRKDIVLSYMLKEFQSMLPKECKNNMLVAFTAVQNPQKIDAIPALKQMQIPVQDNTFWFENTAFLPWQLFFGDDKPEPKSKAHRSYQRLEGFWDESKDEIRNLLKSAVAKIPLPGNSLLEISIRKQVLTQLASKHADKFTTLRQNISKNKKLQQQLADVKQIIEQNEDYERTVTKATKRTRTIQLKSFETRSIAPKKITQCLLCKCLCHNPCGLDAVYSQGHINLKGCKAFGNYETCQICGHGYQHHAHTQEQTIEVFHDKEETYFETEEVQVVDEQKKQIWEENQTTIAEIEELKQMVQDEIDDDNIMMQDAFRVMAFLNKLLEDISYASYNEYFLDYLEYLRETVRKNPMLSKEDKEDELDVLDKAQCVYLAIKEVGFDGPEVALSPEQMSGLQTDFYRLESESLDMVRTHREDRQAFKLEHGMRL